MKTVRPGINSPFNKMAVKGGTLKQMARFMRLMVISEKPIPPAQMVRWIKTIGGKTFHTTEGSFYFSTWGGNIRLIRSRY